MITVTAAINANAWIAHLNTPVMIVWIKSWGLAALKNSKQMASVTMPTTMLVAIGTVAIVVLRNRALRTAMSASVSIAQPTRSTRTAMWRSQASAGLCFTRVTAIVTPITTTLDVTGMAVIAVGRSPTLCSVTVHCVTAWTARLRRPALGRKLAQRWRGKATYVEISLNCCWYRMCARSQPLPRSLCYGTIQHN